MHSQADILASLYKATEGAKWSANARWKDLIKLRRDHTLLSAHLNPLAGTAATASNNTNTANNGNASVMNATMGLPGTTNLAQQLQAQQSQAYILKVRVTFIHLLLFTLHYITLHYITLH